MSTKRARHGGLFRAGLAVAFVGIILGITGLTAAPAGAAPKLTFKITICHRTNAPTNPYREIEVSVNAGNGDLIGPDHTGHDGPVFDFTADPSDPDYPYDTPRNGDQWGDIIPSYPFEGGTFPGQNVPAGSEILANNCQGPEGDPEPDPECPEEGQVWFDANDNSAIDEGECLTEIECPENTEWVDENENGIEETGECETLTVFECPVDTTGSDKNGNGVVDEGECVSPAAVVVPTEPEVAGEVITPAAAELPKTGTRTGQLTVAALGLILIGAGALLIAQPKKALIGR